MNKEQKTGILRNSIEVQETNYFIGEPEALHGPDPRAWAKAFSPVDRSNEVDIFSNKFGIVKELIEWKDIFIRKT